VKQRDIKELHVWAEKKGYSVAASRGVVRIYQPTGGEVFGSFAWAEWKALILHKLQQLPWLKTKVAASQRRPARRTRAKKVSA
jgi:hypothetical protein